MIKLSAPSTTTVTSVFNGVTSVFITDTLHVSYVELNLPAGQVSAMIQRGTMVNGVFTMTQPQLRVNINPDGTFHSQDGAWSGTLPNWSTALATIAASFDNLLLSAGLVTGTEVQ